MKQEPIATVLPYHIAKALRTAAETPIPDHDPLARVKAIEAITEQAKQQYPQFFKKES